MNPILSQKYKLRIYEILETADPKDKAAKTVTSVLLVLIVLNVAAVVLETVASIYQAHKVLFRDFGNISIIIFTIEYLLRIWSCDINSNYKHPLFGRLSYALTPLALIDLMVILPSYMTIAFPGDYGLLRNLRILWTFRLLKLHRYSESLQTIIDVIKGQLRELTMSFTAILFFLVLSSTIVYFLEHDAQPLNFPNIPATHVVGSVDHDNHRHERVSHNPSRKNRWRADNNIRRGYFCSPYVNTNFRFRG